MEIGGKVIIEKKLERGEKLIIKRDSYYQEKFEEVEKNLIITDSLYTLVYSADNNFQYAYAFFLRPYVKNCCN